MGPTKRITRQAFLRSMLVTAGGVAVTALAAACSSAAPASPTTAPAPTTAPSTGGSQSAAAPTTAAPTAQAASSSSGATIRFYTSTAAANLPAWKAAVAAFEKKYPKYKVNLEYTPGQQYWDKLNVEYAGGDVPDMIYSPPANAEDVAVRGMVVDLTSYIQGDNFDMSNLNAASQRAFQWGGKVWGICCFNDTRYTIYNKTLFKKAGLPDLPQTWDGDFSLDTFLDYAKKLTNPDEQTWGFVFEGNQPAARFSWLFGAYYWDSMDYPTKCVMDSPEGQAGLQYVQDLIYKHKVAPSVAANTGGSDPMFMTGKVGMVWAGFKSAAAIYKPIKDFEWGISTIPMGKRRVSNLSPQSFQMVNKSKIPADTWNLLRFCTDDEGNALMCNATSMPANKKIDFSKVSPLQPWENKLLQDALAGGLPEVPHPNIKPSFWPIFNAEMDKLMANSEDGSTAAKTMTSKINEAFQPYVVAK
jgi:multiple sugar transport system substrate-binding protein